MFKRVLDYPGLLVIRSKSAHQISQKPTQDQAAGAADATACIDASVGASRLKNGWRRR